MTPTTVRHINDGTFDPLNTEHVYIGRPMQNAASIAARRGSPFANPFVIPRDGDRESVIAQYRAWLAATPAVLAAVPSLKGKTLYCWCAPSACHGDVLAELADKEADDTTMDEAIREAMRREVDAGTPIIMLTCAPDAYHMVVDGVTYERAALLLKAAVRAVDRHLARSATATAIVSTPQEGEAP